MNYGDAPSHASLVPYRTTGRAVIACFLMLWAADRAVAQQANQPGYDPRQTEKHFDDLQSGQGQPAKPAFTETDTHTFKEWCALDPSIAGQEQAFRDRYGAQADQLMDHATLTARIGAVPPPPAQPKEEAAEKKDDT